MYYFCSRLMIQNWRTTEGWCFSTRFGAIYSLSSSYLALANYYCICAGFARDKQNFATGEINLRRRDFSCQDLRELSLVGENVSNLSSPCGQFDFAHLDTTTKLQQSHTKFTQKLHYNCNF